MSKEANNAKKDLQLGMSHGTANHQLRKLIMFRLMQKCGEDLCYQCGEKIETVEELSVEHKIPWLDSGSADLFWDMDNITFSHLSCNAGSARHPNEGVHGRHRYWKYGCRCEICVNANKATEDRRKARQANLLL